jgi:hypothetical protein
MMTGVSPFAELPSTHRPHSTAISQGQARLIQDLSQQVPQCVASLLDPVKKDKADLDGLGMYSAD